MKIKNKEIATITFNELTSFTEVITLLEEIATEAKQNEELIDCASSLAHDLSEFLNHYTEMD